jgi:hypothetical protein
MYRFDLIIYKMCFNTNSASVKGNEIISIDIYYSVRSWVL